MGQKVIGVTGKSGSGKTTFALALSQELNYKYVDVDKIGHQASSNPDILKKLCEKFGKEILDKDGNLDRKKLGDIVFSEKEKMQQLTDLTWDYMKDVLNKLLEQHDKIILDWCLLPITEYWDKCDIKILVIADDVERKNKILQRDKISEEYLNKREAASVDYLKYSFDYIFENDYKEKSMKEMIEKIKA